MIGTWAYMAPERISTGQSDARADIYALACVFYECLTGSQPFPGDSLEQQIGGHLTQPPPHASDRHPQVPAALDTVIAKGMAKNPDHRYATTRELARAASSALTAPATRQQPVFPTAPARLNNPYPNPVPDRPLQFGNVANPYPVPPPSVPSPTDPTQYGPMPYGSMPPGPNVPIPPDRTCRSPRHPAKAR